MTGGGDTDQQTSARTAGEPDPDLRTLERLVGTWQVSGEAEGSVTYEWTPGGFFLLQHVELERQPRA